MYNQAVGRFASEDILKGDVHSPLSLNNYTYCWNQPLDFVDLDGLCRCCVREYIVRYAEARNPDYPEWADGNCANFVSQALAAGGVEQTFGRWFIDPVTVSWRQPAIYLNTFARHMQFLGYDVVFNDASCNDMPVLLSRSWNHSRSQFNFFSNPANGFINGYPIRVNGVTDIQRVLANYNIQVGDLMFMDIHGRGVGHSAIVSDVLGHDIIYSQNTSDRFDVRLSDLLWNRPYITIFIVRLNDNVFDDCNC